MNTVDLKKLLERVRAGRMKPDEALRRLRLLPYEDLGFAKVDNHRQLRRGFPEVIFGEGKSVPQIVAIMGRVASKRQPVLVTRVTPDVYKKVRRRYRGARYHQQARAITLEVPGPKKTRPGILVLAAGTSDLPVAEEAAVTAEILGNDVVRVYDVGIAGLHRLLDHKNELLRASDRALLGIKDDHPSFRIGAYTFGGARDVWNTEKFSMAIGSDLTFYSKPAVLDRLYGNNPVSWRLFLRLRPAKMDMNAHAMHGNTAGETKPKH